MPDLEKKVTLTCGCVRKVSVTRTGAPLVTRGKKFLCLQHGVTCIDDVAVIRRLKPKFVS